MCKQKSAAHPARKTIQSIKGNCINMILKNGLVFTEDARFV